MAFSLLLLRRHSSQNRNLHRAIRFLFLSHHNTTTKPFSSLSSVQTDTTSSDQPKPSSLSSRMSFVFDQIDAIEKERSQKDETLQRIRSWRESKKNKTNVDNNTTPGLGLESFDSNSKDSKLGELESKKKESGGLLNKVVELVHPWPEWIELMERLVQQNYFDHRRKDEDKMVEDLGFDMSEVAEEGFDFTRDWKTVQTACLNFGRDRFDILRSLSRQDIQILVGYGCPSTDKKVVFAAKLLRKHVHLDEGDVCSSCSLRSSCERAYLLTNKEDEARTFDVMRVLLTYGFDPVNGSVVNKSLLKLKSLKTVVRKLLHEVVKLSAVPIDPNLPPPVIKKPPPKVKQPPPPPKKRVGRDDIEMKKGDWLCPKCDFMNFAKNTVCLQCDAKRPKRQLLPGEWECPECNFLNYRRNMVCFHCEHKRPPDEFMESRMQERQRGPRMRLEKVSSRPEVSNAWNFDFDDDESDGADVAAFEYADSRKLDEDFPLDGQAQGENVRGAEDGFYNNSRPPRAHKSEYSDPIPKKPGMGFDDFDDEEDDVDSYELDTQNNNQVQKTSSIDFSELEVNSESEDIESTNGNWLDRHRTSSPARNKPSKQMRQKAALSGSEDDELDFDSDEDLPVHPNWKSSHVANSRQRTRGRGAMSFGSDEDLGNSSGSEDIVDDDFASRQNKGNKWGSGRRDFGRRGRTNVEDEPFSGLESDDEDQHFRREKLRGNKAGPDRRGKTSKGRGNVDVSENSRFKENFNRSSQGSHSKFCKDDYDGRTENFNRSSRGSHSKFRKDDYGGRTENFNRSSRGGHSKFRKDDYGGRTENFNRSSRGGHSRFRKDDYDGHRREGFCNQRRGRLNNFDKQSDMDSSFDDERPRRPRINVR